MGEKNDTAGPDGVDPDFTVEVTSSEPLAGGYSLVIKDNAPDKRIGVIGAFGKQWRDAPVVEVSFKARVKPSGGRNNNAVYLRTDPGDKRVGVRWFGDESLQCLVDGRWRTFAQYEPGKINQYRIVVNSTDGTFDVWVNDEQALTGSPLGGDPNLGIDRVEFNSGVISASVVEWAVDDIKVTAR